MNKIKVRFNLGKGENFMKWKIQYPNGNVMYYKPNDVQLIMTNCIFKNHKKIAQKIFEGSHKVVCAWIICENIKINTNQSITDETNKVCYNPRVKPNWLFNEKIMDDNNVEQIHTINNGVYISKID
jgi:hypothetical protein